MQCVQMFHICHTEFINNYVNISNGKQIEYSHRILMFEEMQVCQTMLLQTID